MNYYIMRARRRTPTNSCNTFGPYSPRSSAFRMYKTYQLYYGEYHIYHVICASSEEEALAIYKRRIK